MIDTEITIGTIGRKSENKLWLQWKLQENIKNKNQKEKYQRNSAIIGPFYDFWTLLPSILLPGVPSVKDNHNRILYFIS